MRLYKLTGPAAVTVAAALAARASMPAGWELYFVSADEDQLDAAQAEGFEVYRPHEL